MGVKSLVGLGSVKISPEDLENSRKDSSFEVSYSKGVKEKCVGAGGGHGDLG